MPSSVALLGWWFPEGTWLIPVIGVLVTGAAFVVGRRLLPGRKPPSSSQPEAEDRVFLQGAKLERRAVPRRAGNCVGVFVSETPPELGIQGWVLNRSAGGLALLLQQPLKDGARLHVRPITPQSSPAWVAVEIRHCKAEGGDWVANCQFVNPPEYSTLLLFG
jgi:hypothetical protein